VVEGSDEHLLEFLRRLMIYLLLDVLHAEKRAEWMP